MLVAFCAALGAVFAPGPGFTAAASPSPAPSAASPPPAVHTAIVTCEYAAFYSWPTTGAAPAPASYPAARMGDAFHVVGDPVLSSGGMLLYETTIDVVSPWGAGKQYWVSQRCVNVTAK